jgi:Uncharacterised protein conserved in bacteria (DUF2336)
MTKPPLYPGFDGLMRLSRREGVDIRPTLLRVLTDLYVQASAHSADEERQYVELASRLIDQVDDATRAVVRARLSVYPGTPIEISKKLGLNSFRLERHIPLADAIPPTPQSTEAPASAPAPAKPLSEAQLRLASNLSMQPKDAAEIDAMFSRAGPSERAAILHNLAETPLQASARIPTARARRAIVALEMAAFAADVENFTQELSETLILPARVAAEVVNDPGGESLACAAKALDMPSEVFQRILLFLKPELGSSVEQVYRLARLYDRLSERSALIMLAAWRGSTMAVARAKYHATLYDDERHRARPTPSQTRPVAHTPGSTAVPRTDSQH